MVVSSCRELDNNRSALSAASAFAIATAGANEGTPTKEKYRRMSLASTGQSREKTPRLDTSRLRKQLISGSAIVTYIRLS